MYLHSHPLIRIPIHIRKWTPDLFTDTESFLSRSLVVQFHDDTKRAFAGHSDRTIMTNGVSRTCFPSFLLSFSTFFFSSFFPCGVDLLHGMSRERNHREMRWKRHVEFYGEETYIEEKKKRGNHYMKI